MKNQNWWVSDAGGWKTLILIVMVGLLFLSVSFSQGCAGPTVSIKKDGSVETKGCQAITLNGESKNIICKSWFDFGFLDTIITSLAGLVGGQISSPKKVEADKVNNTAKVEKFGFRMT